MNKILICDPSPQIINVIDDWLDDEFDLIRTDEESCVLSSFFIAHQSSDPITWAILDETVVENDQIKIIDHIRQFETSCSLSDMLKIILMSKAKTTMSLQKYFNLKIDYIIQKPLLKNDLLKILMTNEIQLSK
jgi:CheY-like chemotaxis protein